MEDLKDKNCFITGAASGIGRSFAIALAKEGMNVFISDIDLESLQKVKRDIEDLGSSIWACKCDVSKFKDFENAAKEFYSKLGNLDLLINNAGIAVGGDMFELELEDWKSVLDVNLWSIIHSLKIFLPRMVERGSGHIVNVASGAGVFGSSEPLPYITSKFAVVGLSEALFGRLRNFGIDVSVVIPSYIKTNIFDSMKTRYSKKLVNEIGKEKLMKIEKNIIGEIKSRSMDPDRAVKKYIRGIKKKQLYVFDLRTPLILMALKGQKPQQYEEFLLNYNKNFANIIREQFLKYGMDVNLYM